MGTKSKSEKMVTKFYWIALVIIASLSLTIYIYCSISVVLESTHSSTQISDAILTLTHSSIDDLFSNWMPPFHCIVLQENKKIHSALHPYNVSTRQCITTEEVQTLLNHTHTMLNIITSMHSSRDFNAHPITSPSKAQQYSYHDFIRLRRQIITSMQFLQLDIQHSTAYRDLMQIFAQLFRQHVQNRKEYPWFHIHVTKAAGTTVSHTFWDYFHSKSNNYYYTAEDHTCEQQYQSADIIKSQFLTRELPLFTFNDYLDRRSIYHGASLCNKNIYLMGFREPVQRVCSQLSQMNKLAMFSNQNLLRTYASYMQIAGNTEERDHCFHRNVSVNGVDYRFLVKARDYRGLFVDLLPSEKEEKYMRLGEIHSVEDLDRRMKLTAKVTTDLNVSIDDCIKGKPSSGARWEALRFVGNKIDREHRPEFLLYTTKQKVDVAYHRGLSGSNVYTAWLGYNYSRRNVRDFSMIPNYVPRYQLTEAHLWNALNVALKIDYVMPLTRERIWNVTLDHLYEYFMLPGKYKLPPRRNRSETRWVLSNVSGGRGSRISSKAICESLTEKDKEILLEYNQHDYVLYAASQLIADADVLFYDKYLSIV